MPDFKPLNTLLSPLYLVPNNVTKVKLEFQNPNQYQHRQHKFTSKYIHYSKHNVSKPSSHTSHYTISETPRSINVNDLKPLLYRLSITIVLFGFSWLYCWLVVSVLLAVNFVFSLIMERKQWHFNLTLLLRLWFITMFSGQNKTFSMLMRCCIYI